MKQALLIAAVFGVVDPKCTVELVCQPDYTETVRPSTFYTTNLKIEQFEARHLPGKPSDYWEDHILPLELCGAPKDPKNLMPELIPRARAKDVLETRFHRLVCKGKMKIEDAQREIIKFE